MYMCSTCSTCEGCKVSGAPVWQQQHETIRLVFSYAEGSSAARVAAVAKTVVEPLQQQW